MVSCSAREAGYIRCLHPVVYPTNRCRQPVHPICVFPPYLLEPDSKCITFISEQVAILPVSAYDLVGLITVPAYDVLQSLIFSQGPVLCQKMFFEYQIVLCCRQHGLSPEPYGSGLNPSLRAC